MKKNKEITWPWQGKSIPMSKLTEGQLVHVKEYLKKQQKPFVFGIHKKDYFNEIKSIENNRAKENTDFAIEQVELDSLNRIRGAVDRFMGRVHKVYDKYPTVKKTLIMGD